ncbi:unnamed protein product [Schistocephalus solidus]|uniref:TAP-C domain-containing protein n=1 Tax=Schistocephalus solidus TaxID=70667 RepID=A0A183TT46_SCHSO|nr:unnamed protein product [Schistocephalus solidus]
MTADKEGTHYNRHGRRQDATIDSVNHSHEKRHSGVIQRAIEEWTKRSSKDGDAGAVGSASVNTVVGTVATPGGVGDGVGSSAVSEDEFMVKIAALSAGTGMKREFSRQCLEECAWSLDLAFEAFRRVREAGMLPEAAVSE